MFTVKRKLSKMKNLYQIGDILKAIPVFFFGITFTVATVLFSLLAISKQREDYIQPTAYFAILMIVLNAIAFFGLLLLSCFFRKHRADIAKRTLLLLLNIPVTAIYTYLLFEIIKL